MDTLAFLRAVLAEEGFYCIVGLKKEPDRPVQKFFPTLDAAIEVAKQLQTNGFDSYYALATFIEGTSRKVANANLLKAFWLDLDCGAGKKYLTQPEAIQALRAFCKTTALPRPMLVNSGRGIHAYWPIEEGIPADTWLPVAQALKDLCVKHSLHADPACTADVARVLRVPNTLNFKDEPPNPVEVLNSAVITTPFKAFKEAVGTAPMVVKGYAPREMDEATQLLLGSYVSKFKRILDKTMAGTGCQQLGHIAMNQTTIEEPLWRAGLSIADRCVDRDKAIHLISKKHPDYTPERTARKAALTKGPYTCETFGKLNPGGCEGCPNRDIIRSPITLGREVEEASDEDNIVQAKPADSPTAPDQTYTIPKYPAPYLRGKNGGVFKRVRGEDADIEIPIYHNDIYVVRRLVDPELGEAVLIRLHLPKDGVREFTVPLVAVTSKEEFRKHMAPKGVAMAKIDELMYYIIDWVTHLQMNATADIARRQFGWTDEHLTGFIVGDKEVRADRINLNPPSRSTAAMFSYFTARGTLDEWKATMEFFNKPGMELHQFGIGLSFGSPLMAFTAVNASMVHLWSPGSGLGKTAVLQAAASVWGNPDEIMTTENDTINTRMNRAEVYKNIILPMDELTNATGKELSDMLYMYTSGHQRNRMSRGSNVERFRGDAWQQIGLSTGNKSVMDIIAAFKAMPKGEAARVLDLEVTAANLPNKTVTDELSLRLKRVYGTAYIPYLQYVMQNVEEVRKLWQSTQIRLDKAIGFNAPDRFPSATASTCITGLIVAKRIGLINWEIAPLVRWLIPTMKTTKAAVDSLDIAPEAVLNNFLAENYNNILRIKSTDDGRHRTQDTELLIIPDGTPRISLVARYEYDIKQLYIMPKPFKEWCSKCHINVTSLIAELKKGRTRAAMEPKRMGRGTRMNLPSALVLRIDCTEFMDDEPVVQ